MRPGGEKSKSSLPLLFQFLKKNEVFRMISKISCLKTKPTILPGVETKQQQSHQTDSIKRTEQLWIGIQGIFRGNFNSVQMVKGDLYFGPEMTNTQPLELTCPE